MFYLHANKNNLAVSKVEKITSGSVGVNTVKFCFSKEWDGTAKTVLFKAKKEQISIILDENDTCKIPWEALKVPNAELFVGVYGTRGGDLVMPTIWAKLGTIREGATMDEEPEPTPGIYDQLMNKIVETAEKIPVPMTAEELIEILTKDEVEEDAGENS